MKKTIKFLGIVFLCLFIMIPAARALTDEQVREEILSQDVVIDMSETHSSNYNYYVSQSLNTIAHTINDSTSISIVSCTYDACAVVVHYYDPDAEQHYRDIDVNVPIKKYGVVYNEDDIVLNHAGDSIAVGDSYKVLDEEFNELESELDYFYLAGEEDNHVTINDETNTVTFNEPGYYEVSVNITDENDENHYSHIAVLTDTQALINNTLSGMDSFDSDRTDVSDTYDVKDALEYNLKREILTKYGYLSTGETHTDVKSSNGNEHIVNVDFTVQLRNVTLNFVKNNLLVREVGINFSDSTVKLNLTDNKTHQIIYTLYSPSVEWRSSNPAVASVSSTGLVTALSSGATLITANMPGGLIKGLIVMVEDNGEMHTHLNEIAATVGDGYHRVHVPAVSDLNKDILYDEVYSAVYDAMEEATDDENVTFDIVEMDEENFRTAKIIVGYGYYFKLTENNSRYANYCKVSDWDDGFECASDEYELEIVFANDVEGFNESLRTKANQLANNFNFNKTYVSDTNTTISEYLADTKANYYALFYKNANLNESIQNEDGFIVRPYYRMGGVYSSAYMKGGDALIVKDGILYAAALADAEKGLNLKSVLRVTRPGQNQTVIDAITDLMRRMVNDNAVEIQVKVCKYAETDPVLGQAYEITLHKEGNEAENIPYLEMYVETYVELVDEEVGPIEDPNALTAIHEITVTGIVAPVEGEHPTTENIRITTPGLTLKSAVWVEDKENGKELTNEDTFVTTFDNKDAKYMLRLIFDIEEGYDLENPDIISSERAGMDELVGCEPGEPCVSDRDLRLYYGVKSAVPVAITAIPDINIANDKNEALKLDIAYDQNATYLEVYRSTSKTGTYKKIATIEEGYYRDTNLVYGTTYYYKVKACNTVGCSALSQPKSGKIVPKKVEGVNLVEASTTQVKLGWTKFENMTGYEISRSTKANGTYKVVATTKNVDNFTNTGLAGSTTYFYRVRAYQLVNKVKVYGEYSEVLEVKTAPVAPKLSLTGSEYNSLKLKVASVATATSYEIYRSTSKNGEYTKVATLEEAGEFTDTDVETGKAYYYKARACAAYCGAFSALVSKVPVLSAPTFTASVTESKKVAIAITEVAGADGYEISRSLYKNKKFTVVTETEELSLDLEANLNKTYYYRVRAYRIVDEKKTYSSYSTLKTAKVTLGVPTFTLTKENLNDITINITGVTGAVGYEVVKSVYKTRRYAVAGTTTELTYTEKGKLNSTYYYKVRAYILVNGAKQYSGYSKIKSTKSVLGVPTLSFERVSLTTANINVTPVTYAEGYEIYRSLYKTKRFALVADVTDPTYLDTLTLNTTYYYKVRAYVLVDGVKQYSKYSKVKSNKLTLATPTFAIERTALNKVNINITALEDAEGYEIYRSLYKNKKFALVKDTTELTVEDLIKFNTTYYYKVRAYIVRGGKKYYSGYTALKTVKLGLAAPTYNLEAQAGQVEVRVDAVEYAEGYEIYKATSRYGKYVKDGEITETVYNSAGTANKTYYYKVRAYATINEKRVYGGYSIVKSAKVLPLPLPE